MTVAKKKKNRTGLVVSSVGVAAFLGLMAYALNRDPNALPSQLVNKPVPAFVSNVAQGGQFDMQDHVGKGRWVVMNFWSTTCIVCREEAPELERFYTQVSSQGGPLFVSVNIQESNAEIMEYMKNYRLSFPVVSDKSGKISLDFGVTGTPETFFVDPQGKVRHRVAGGVDGDSILRFIDWLEKNGEVSAEQAMRGFTQLRSGVGG